MYNGSAEDTHLAQWNGKFLFQNVDWDSPTHPHSSCSDTDLSLWEWHVVPKSVNGDRLFSLKFMYITSVTCSGRDLCHWDAFCSVCIPKCTYHTELAQLHRLPVQARISYKIACLGFSSINSSTPNYLSDIRHLFLLLSLFSP